MMPSAKHSIRSLVYLAFPIPADQRSLASQNRPAKRISPTYLTFRDRCFARAILIFHFQDLKLLFSTKYKKWEFFPMTKKRLSHENSKTPPSKCSWRKRDVR